jgi:hypothetical protein
MENCDKPLMGITPSLTKSPLGIIALFILLVYGLASVVFITSPTEATSERSILIWFIVIFPVVVLSVFTWLVVSHHEKLFGPSDFQDETIFFKTISSKYPSAKELVESNILIGSKANLDLKAQQSEKEELLDTVGQKDLAVVKARIQIEKKLREILSILGEKETERMSLHGLIQSFFTKLPQYSYLQDAITNFRTISNLAVHGQDLAETELEHAIELAASILTVLSKIAYDSN